MLHALTLTALGATAALLPPQQSTQEIFETMRARQSTIPAPIIARIGADVAAGLHYAHTATDGSGTPLDIVHRDVTPSNIIVGFTGTTKIVDFGIAKAQVRDSQTRSGALKGKMAYLSPEQIEDATVDHRTDVFQLGIVLHEMLTGLRLFDADGDHQKMMAVMERPILPPSEVNPYVPKVFDEVILRALDRDVSKRTQSADQLRRELEYALKQLGSTVSAHDVSDWMQSTLADRYNERVAMERESVSQMRSGSRPPSSAPKAPSGESSSGGKTPTLATVVGRPSSMTKKPSERKRGTRAFLVLGAFVGIVIGAILFWRGTRGGGEDPPSSDTPVAAKTTAGALGDEAPETFSINLQVEPREGVISIDGKRLAEGAYVGEFTADGKAHTVEVRAVGYETWRIVFTNTLPAQKVELRRLPAGTAMADRSDGQRPGSVRSATPKGARTKTTGGSKSGGEPVAENLSGQPAETSGSEGSQTPEDRVKSGATEGSGANATNNGSTTSGKGDKWRKGRSSDNIDPWKRKR